MCFPWVNSYVALCKKGYCFKKVLKSLSMTLIRVTATAGPHHKPAGSISFRPTFPFQIEISLLKIHRGRKGRGWEGSLSEVRLICLQPVWGAQRHGSSQASVYSLILNRWVVRLFLLAGTQWMSDLNGERAGGAARGQSFVSSCHRQSVLGPLWVAERGWWTQLTSVRAQRETLSPGTWERQRV